MRELVDGTLTEAGQRARAVAPHLDIPREVVIGEPLMVLEIESRTASLVVVVAADWARSGACCWAPPSYT
ncbi:hypothetical protein [Streptomyces sp. NPDC014744]|uniref:hypothetical protein n=1 Tax=Streptomyces sp. NPDC014744 TaxID=3364903 RepID=UPI0036FAC6F9